MKPVIRITTLIKKQSVTWLLAGDGSKGWAIQSFTVNGEDQLKSL